MRTTKALAAAALATTALLTVGACGGSTGGGTGSGAAASSEPAGNGVADKSADEILAAAKTAAKAQSSVRIEGSLTEDGEETTMDLSLDRKGQADTTMSKGGSKVQVISTGTTAYIRGNKQFWISETEAGEAGYELFKDKWLVASSAAELGQLGPMADFSSMIDELLKPSGTISKGSTADIDGTPAIGLVDGKTGTLWVATTGEPLPLQIENADGNTLTFTWGAPVTITVPDPADVIDPSALGQ